MNSQDQKVFEEYLENHFYSTEFSRDDSFLENWKPAFELLKEKPAACVINEKLCPLRPVDFANPEGISLELYTSFAGNIPVIKVCDAGDFEQLVTSVIYKGIRPENIASTGASFAFGKTNRFIILSNKPYSNVPAHELGLEENEWKQKSMAIRLEHECNHYYTKWRYGVAKNHIHDELMADFFGLMNAFGFYKAEWFLRFMGIVGTSGSRLKCYVPECSEEFFEELKKTAVKAAEFLERWSLTEEFKKMTRMEQADYLCRKDLGTWN